MRASELPADAQYIAYPDLGGGLNTRKDPHALERNELALSVNCWPAYDRALAKRPGNVAIITADGKTGAGTAGTSLCSCRFGGITYLLSVQNGSVYAAAMNGTSWTYIGSVNASAKFITAAQMFDPSTAAVNPQDGLVFICDGLSTPQYWKGPGNTLTSVAAGGTNLPYRPGTTTPITPQFVHTLGNNSHLFYAGDPTMPSAVFISDPFFPQSFTAVSQQGNPLNVSGGYLPAIIGNNDGVEGGAITGLETLGGMMLVFKEAAIYSMFQTTLLGEVPVWQVQQVSNSVGCLSPRSLTRFDTFVAFLAIDGVYITDGGEVRKVSGDVPTYFDSSLNGVAAMITNRTTAIGVRHANKLLLAFYSSASTYCDRIVWFDFDKQSSSGNPLAGEIQGMYVGGAVALRGPQDDGNVAWVDATKDRVGKFGIGGTGDFGNAIASTFATRADLMSDLFGDVAPICEKQSQSVYLQVAVLGVQSQVNLNFVGIVAADLNSSYQQAVPQPVQSPANGGSSWGSFVWGGGIWGGGASTGQFFVVKMESQGPAKGRMLQIVVQESSTVPWVVVGLIHYINVKEPSF